MLIRWQEFFVLTRIVSNLTFLEGEICYFLPFKSLPLIFMYEYIHFIMKSAVCIVIQHTLYDKKRMYIKYSSATYNFTSSSGRFWGIVENPTWRHVSWTSSDVPVQVQPCVLHGSQISFNVLPKSPYCLSASSYSRLASSSVFFDEITTDSCSKNVSDNLEVCILDRVSLHLVKFKSTKAIRSRWLFGM